MWYGLAKSEFQDVQRSLMVRQAGAVDNLWRSLYQAGIADRMGLTGPQDLQPFLGDQRFLEEMGRETSNVPSEALRHRIQESFSNFKAGRILGEEIRRARETAATLRGEGAEPTVSEMRAARQNANRRITEEAAVEGLGLPKEFVVGQRGRLRELKPASQRRTPLLKDIAMAPKPLEDQDLANVVGQIYRDEVSKIRTQLEERFRAGLIGSPQPTAADMRQAVRNANDRINQMGLDHIVFEVGARGRFPSAGPRVTERIENEKHYWARRKAREKADNLGLQPPIDVNPETPVVLQNPYALDPNDNRLPQETEIENRERETFDTKVRSRRSQAAYPFKPPLHNRCRCSIINLGMGQQWLTAGDDAVCPECQRRSDEFNSMRPV